ncbi:M20/M25/M40 family metallo-hydrolase [Acetivibrio clariflavus]|uniref:Peptidase T-like protein n=1 Tax=Acetivibrio clariflavus (strain DSM 19732 / NBRC 101661 / EBR45) TaxID=720554 RepID=G8LY90_ACECE|nr:M20/M25/M40 family metallo-hydrolase [Acetivibrio clariflavus]AEV67821.1 peptidase T-like protein [Acetivibrio clariflavus DSM 19732]HOQ01653.1 M20/M25/M40 family metallo-hydrolase [Acetivibrio clariflavus]HPU42407.1 M20/M25/M40 family metallo-hydrolase [Acetivibrio clariflavus]
MVNRQRMVDEFLELVRIDSLTYKEKEMAECLKAKLSNMGLSVEEDDAGIKIGGNSGNLICKIDGNKSVPAVLLMAHMDTVTPGIGKKPVIDGNIIRTDGTTVLGGDDAAGIECILEAIRVLKENNLPHGDIFVVFTVAEEGGLWGAKNLDISRINAKYAFVMDDGGNIGHVAVNAPAQNKIDVIVTGKAAHAGMEPEKGVSAIQIAAEAISNMKLGRIDDETTANVGVINGGQATNIICDKVEIKAEARSRDMIKLQSQTEHMKECFYNAAQKYGGSIDFKSELLYPSFSISEQDDIIKILKEASKKAGVELVLEATGGGSDTNIINSKGIKAVDVSVGMDKVHSVEEQICIDDLVKAAEFLIAIITSIK